jgi:hypothetical protein
MPMIKSVVDNVVFSILNPTKKTVILKKNAVVASLQTFDSVKDCIVLNWRKQKMNL